MATLSLQNLPRFEPGTQALNAKKKLNIINGAYDWTRANKLGQQVLTFLRQI